jgi:hypothetical protein
MEGLSWQKVESAPSWLREGRVLAGDISSDIRLAKAAKSGKGAKADAKARRSQPAEIPVLGAQVLILPFDAGNVSEDSLPPSQPSLTLRASFG